MTDRHLGRLLAVLRLAGRSEVLDLAARRTSFAAFIARLPGTPPFRLEQRELGGVLVDFVEPAEGVASDGLTILYFHGGGYCMGSAATHRPLAARLAQQAQARVLVPEYRLAPEHPFPAAFDDCSAVWSAVAERTPAERLVVGGDSAGGGLTLAGAIARNQRREILPAALFAWSPWVDLTATATSIDGRAARDPLIDRAGLEGMAKLYLGDLDPRDPRVSPLFAPAESLVGLPPTLLQVGEAECLYDDCMAIAARLRSAEVPVELAAWPEMIHVWPLYSGVLPAGDEAIARLAEGLRAHVGAPAPG